MFRLYKNKWFWIIWLFLSVTGGIIGYILSNQRTIKLQNSEIAICRDYRNLKQSSIIAITDRKNKDDYLKALTDTNIKYVDFRFIGIENGQKVKILDYSIDSTIVNIAIVREKSTATKPKYEEVWIWRNFLEIEKNRNNKNVPQQSAKNSAG